MDEPTSGLDARAAAIVMHTLLLMKIGGQIIFAGTLGHQSHKLVEYFQAIPGVPKIRNGYNPATWALDLTSSAEIQLNVDYAQIYANSALYEYIPKFTFSDNTATPRSARFVGRYGSCKNLKKTVKAGQTRTRERKREYKSQKNAFKVKHWSTLGQPKSTHKMTKPKFPKIVPQS
ncbi:hypothetical protein Tco_1309232 [Tanacetum coccineum]